MQKMEYVKGLGVIFPTFSTFCSFKFKHVDKIVSWYLFIHLVSYVEKTAVKSTNISFIKCVI